MSVAAHDAFAGPAGAVVVPVRPSWLLGVFLDALLGVSAFIAGPINTVPKKMYNDLMLEITPTITAVATVLIVATALVLLIAGRLTRRASV